MVNDSGSVVRTDSVSIQFVKVLYIADRMKNSMHKCHYHSLILAALLLYVIPFLFHRISRSKQLIKDAILDNDFLKKLDSTQIREVVECMYEKQVQQSHFIIREGDAGQHVYVAAGNGCLEIYIGMIVKQFYLLLYSTALRSISLTLWPILICWFREKQKLMIEKELYLGWMRKVSYLLLYSIVNELIALPLGMLLTHGSFKCIKLVIQQAKTVSPKI